MAKYHLEESGNMIRIMKTDIVTGIFGYPRKVTKPVVTFVCNEYKYTTSCRMDRVAREYMEHLEELGKYV